MANSRCELLLMLLILLMLLRPLWLGTDHNVSTLPPRQLVAFESFKSITEVEKSLPHYDSYVLVTYDPVSCIHCYSYAKRLLTSLHEQDFVTDYEVGLGLVNTRDFDMPRLKRGGQLAAGLAFIQRGQVRFYQEFRELTEQGRPYRSYHERVLGQTLNFIQQFLKPLTEVPSIQFVEEAVERNNLIGVYLGNGSPETFNLFKAFAKQNSDFPLYYTLNDQLSQQIPEHFHVFSKRPVENGFAMIRSKNLADPLDRHQLALLPQITSLESLQQFFTQHRYPKLITDATWIELLMSIKKGKASVLMLISDSTETSADYVSEFREAVEKLPRAALFVHIQRPNPIADLPLLKKMGDNAVVFLFQAGKDANIVALPMRSNISKENVSQFFQVSLVLKNIVADLTFATPSQMLEDSTKATVKEIGNETEQEREVDEVTDAVEEADERDLWQREDPRFADLFETSRVARLSGSLLLGLLTLFFNN